VSSHKKTPDVLSSTSSTSFSLTVDLQQDLPLIPIMFCSVHMFHNSRITQNFMSVFVSVPYIAHTE